MAKNLMEKLLTKEEIAEITGLSVPFIYKAVSAQGFPHYKIGRNLKFRISEVEKWISQRKRAS